MAARFARGYKDKFIHTPGRGWLEFTGSHWEECGETRPWQGVEVICREALRELADLPVDDRNKLIEDVRRCDSADGTAGVLKHAKHWPGIARRDEQLDARPELFVTRNGTYELSTDVFRASDPRDLMTLAGGVDYDPDAQAPTYDALMAQYQPDPAVRAYLHRLGGAAMHGTQNLQQLIVHYGATGGNGKGTTQRAWEHVFGAFADVVDVGMLLARRGYDQYRDDKAMLKGKRLLYATEPSPGQRFDAGTINSLTGNDTVKGAQKYKSAVSFKPSWLIMMSTNNRVGVVSNGGSNRRLKEIGWGYTVPRDQMRSDLDEILRAEGPGILNRLLAGWRDFRDNGGPREPGSVQKDTAEYLASVDPYTLFRDEVVLPKPGVNTPSSSFYKAYCDWCADNGEHPRPQREFSPEMEKHYQKKRGSGGMVWADIALTNRL